MKPQELRINNWVLIPANGPIKIPAIPKQIKGITKFGELDFTEPHYPEPHLVHFKHCAGIPLTEDLLLKAGFERHEGGHNIMMYSLPSLTLACYISGFNGYWLRSYQGNQQRKILYFHELQNILYDLTGQELTIQL